MDRQFYGHFFRTSIFGRCPKVRYLTFQDPWCSTASAEVEFNKANIPGLKMAHHLWPYLNMLFPYLIDYLYFDNSLVCVIAHFIYSYLRSYSLGVKQLYHKVILGKLCFMLAVEGTHVAFRYSLLPQCLPLTDSV